MCPGHPNVAAAQSPPKHIVTAHSVTDTAMCLHAALICLTYIAVFEHTIQSEYRNLVTGTVCEHTLRKLLKHPNHKGKKKRNVHSKQQ